MSSDLSPEKETSQARLQYDDYGYDVPGAPASSSSSSSLFKNRSAIYGTYAGMAMGGTGGILLLAVIIYALIVNSRKKESTRGCPLQKLLKILPSGLDLTLIVLARELDTPQIAYKVAICPRRNILNNQFFLYYYLITSLI